MQVTLLVIYTYAFSQILSSIYEEEELTTQYVWDLFEAVQNGPDLHHSIPST